MTTDRSVQILVIFQQKLGHPLEIGIRRGLVIVDGGGPMILTSDNRLLIPISPFDQPN